MSASIEKNQPIKIAINALGGQGGGVLATWLVELGKSQDYLVQSTSVPGVAQRTGATVYYVEYFPQVLAKEQGQVPVLALMPTPGDVDVVLASEIIEAGRAIDRGFVSDKTTLITSTHRVYAIGEKIAMGDERVETDSIHAAAKKLAKKVVAADLEACVEKSGSIISSVIFGALAGSGAMPFAREAFEAVIVAGKRAVDANLRGFAAGYDAVQEKKVIPVVAQQSVAFVLPEKAATAVQPLLDRLRGLPQQVHEIGFLGLKKVVDHHDVKYGTLYLDRLENVINDDTDKASYVLSSTVAKHLALWMAYEDTIRVADLKTRSTRFERFRDDVRADEGQIVQVREYMHPRMEEIVDMLPAGLAEKILRSSGLKKFIGSMFGKGVKIKTTSSFGFVLLYFVSGLKFLRRSSYKYKVENARIDGWLDLIGQYQKTDYSAAVEIASLQRLIKGYGDTHARGIKSFTSIIEKIPDVMMQNNPADSLKGLKKAALSDEHGEALNSALTDLQDTSQQAA